MLNAASLLRVVAVWLLNEKQRHGNVRFGLPCNWSTSPTRQALPRVNRKDDGRYGFGFLHFRHLDSTWLAFISFAVIVALRVWLWKSSREFITLSRILEVFLWKLNSYHDLKFFSTKILNSVHFCLVVKYSY